MRHLLKIIATLFAAMGFIASCSETCNDNRNALPLAGFYVNDSAGVAASVQIDSLQVIGIGQGVDSVLSSASQSKTELYLPFRIDSDRTQYVFQLHRNQQQINDTVTFDYTRVLRFASAECGVSYVFHIQNISSQGVLIDSVVCPNGFIDNSNIENLRIYIHD